MSINLISLCNSFRKIYIIVDINCKKLINLTDRLSDRFKREQKKTKEEELSTDWLTEFSSYSFSYSFTRIFLMLRLLPKLRRGRRRRLELEWAPNTIESKIRKTLAMGTKNRIVFYY